MIRRGLWRGSSTNGRPIGGKTTGSDGARLVNAEGDTIRDSGLHRYKSPAVRSGLHCGTEYKMG